MPNTRNQGNPLAPLTLEIHRLPRRMAQVNEDIEVEEHIHTNEDMDREENPPQRGNKP